MNEERMVFYDENEPYIVSDVRRDSKKICICVYIIIVANVLIFLISGGEKGNMHELAGVNYAHIFTNHEYGRLIASMFVHSNLEHLLANVVCLWSFGEEVEKTLGSLRFTIIYFLSGILGGIFTAYVDHALRPDVNTYCIGASGAVYAIFVASLFSMYKGKKQDVKKHILIVTVMVMLFAVLTYEKGVSLTGHIGGALFGCIITYIVSTNKWEDYEESKFLKTIAIIITFTMCVMGIGEADIGGRVKDLPNPEIDSVKAMQIYDDIDITYGQALDNYCYKESWGYFISQDKQRVVEFSAECYRGGERVEVYIQFVAEKDMGYEFYYLGFNEVSQSLNEKNQFLSDIVDEFSKNN